MVYSAEITFQSVPVIHCLHLWDIHRDLVVQLDDKYGSPMLEDIEKFARALYRKMEEGMGEEAAGDITVEASSPVRLLLMCLGHCFE